MKLFFNCEGENLCEEGDITCDVIECEACYPQEEKDQGEIEQGASQE